MKAALVLEYIAHIIEEKGFKPGDRLPSERFFCNELSVSRSTIREALKTWQVLGLIHKKKGSGSYLNAQIKLDIAHIPLALQMEAISILQILQIRRALEMEAVRLAVENINEKTIAILREKCSVFEQTLREDGNMYQVDRELHCAIYKATDNPLFETTIQQLYTPFDEIYEDPLKKKVIGEGSFHLHPPLISAIIEGNAEEAMGIMSQILEITQQEIEANYQ